MGSVPRGSDLPTRLAGIERRLGVMERTSRLQSASIGSGGLTVRGGGTITIEDGGNIVISGGGGLSITDGGDISLDGGDLSINEGAIEITGAGGIVVKDGGDIQVQDGGDIIVSGTGQVRSSDFVANTSGWRIANGSAEFNTITLRNGIVGVDALNRRSEGQTFSGSNFSTGGTNQHDLNVTVTRPSWATSVSCLASGSVYGQAADGTRISARITISGTAGTTTYGGLFGGHSTIPALAVRDFAPPASFVVNLHCGAAPVSALVTWQADLAILCVFTRG